MARSHFFAPMVSSQKVALRVKWHISEPTKNEKNLLEFGNFPRKLVTRIHGTMVCIVNY